MTRATRPVRATLHSFETRFPTEAKKRLIATADPRSIGILSDHRESKELSSSVTRKPIPTSDTRAKKNLIATHAKLEIELTHWNHNPLTISNRNKKHVSSTAPSSRFADHGPLFADHGPRINLRPVPTGTGAFLIGNEVRIEIVPTHRNQRKASNSNRYNFRPARRSIWGCGGGGSSISSCRSRFSVPPPLTPHHSPLATNTTPRPSNPSRPVLQWMIRVRHRLETAAGAAASKDLGVGKRETE